nr:D-alanyl-D-alanine carboxypeptidase DacC-like [Nerophis lumbriciformis]
MAICFKRRGVLAGLALLWALDPAAPLGANAVQASAAQTKPVQASAVPASLTAAINTKVSAARKVAPALGVHVVRVADGAHVYGFRADERRIAASNTKLFTSAAALDRLGPGYFFETEVLLRGRLSGVALEGDLAIVGGGDPNLSGRHYAGDSFGAFREWARALKDLGVQRITGDLYLIHGFFDRQYHHPDWKRSQHDRWYQAPVASLAFNDSCTLAKVHPGSHPGAKAQVELVPPLGLYPIDSTAVTSSSGRSVSVGRVAGQKRIAVAGRIGTGSLSYDEWVAVPDPLEYFGVALIHALSEEGIYLDGRLLLTPEVPADRWRRLLTHRTDLLTTLEIVNKRSQNFYAESVFKTLGKKTCDDGTWEGGQRAVEEFLTGVGLAPGSYQMADGSGMSRGNRFAPRQVTTLLRYMHNEHVWGQEYLRTLPYSGERGLRWARRLAKPPYRGNVFAKTGTLSGVSALSGFAKGRSGELYVFSILMNSSRSDWQARAAQDRIVEALIDGG